MFGRAIITAVLLSSASALAADALDLDQIAGVYKHSFGEGDVQGDRYRAEDILEIVPLSPTTAYFRTHLEFFNGHTCDLYGVARQEGDALVFRDPQTDYQGRHCQLRIEKDAKGMTLREADDFLPCKNLYCGARGSFGETFASDERRTIGYMNRLLASDEYKEAVASFAASRDARPAR